MENSPAIRISVHKLLHPTQFLNEPLVSVVPNKEEHRFRKFQHRSHSTFNQGGANARVIPIELEGQVKCITQATLLTPCFEP